MEKLNELIKDIEAVDNMYLDKKNVLKALKIAKKEISKQLLQTDVMQRNCNSFGCVDPDNSGQCIYCGKILDND